MEKDTINPLDAILKDITLRFIIGYERKDFEFVVEMMSNVRIDVSSMITHRIKIEDLPEAFESLRRPKDQCKVMWVADS